MGDSMLPCFRMKPSASGAEFIDVVCTQEAIAKISAMAPVVVVGFQNHAILNGVSTESGLCSLRLEVIPAEMFSDPFHEDALLVDCLDKGAKNENQQPEPPDPYHSDPALDRLRQLGFVK